VVRGPRQSTEYCYGELRVVPASEAEGLRSVASPVEFIPPDRVVPGLSSGARCDYSPHPANQGYVLGATHRCSWAGRDSLRETAWFPGLTICPSAGQHRHPRHYLQQVSTGDVYPTCAQSFPTMRCSDVSKSTLLTNNGLDAVLGPLLGGPDRGHSCSLFAADAAALNHVQSTLA
jgi:hypothetical protein